MKRNQSVNIYTFLSDQTVSNKNLTTEVFFLKSVNSRYWVYFLEWEGHLTKDTVVGTKMTCATYRFNPDPGGDRSTATESLFFHSYALKSLETNSQRWVK